MTEKQAELIPIRPGARLRHERESLGLSIEQVAQKTRIRERILTAIERDDTDSIAPIYLRGYVRNYAAALGIDPGEVEQEARATSGTDPELRSVFNVNRKRGFAERWLKASSYLVATALIAALVWQVTQQAVQFSQGRSGFVKSTPETVQPEGSDETSPASQVPGKQQKTHVAASIASLEKLTDRSALTGNAAQEAWSAINEPVSQDSGISRASVINISVSADSWIEIIDATGQQLEMDLLRGGNQRSYTGTPPFELMLGRATSVVLEYQGQAVDLAPHINGDVARLTLGEPETPTP